MLECVNSIILVRQVLQFIPLSSFEVLKSLVFFEFFPKNFIGTILNLILELQLVLLSHLHFHSFYFFFLFFIIKLL